MTRSHVPTVLGGRRKAEILDVVRPLLSTAIVLPSVIVVRSAWRQDAQKEIATIERRSWEGPLIVRSSASVEDSSTSSAAGHFHTEDHVLGRSALRHAIDRVFASYDRAGLHDEDEQVLIQPMVVDALACGVAAARDHVTGGPYRVVSWSTSGRTDDVTSGRTSDVRAWYEAFTVRPTRVPDEVAAVVDLLDEIEALVGRDFEIEFAVSPAWGLALFQLRSIAGMPFAPPDAVSLLGPIASRVTAVLEGASRGRTAAPLPGGPTALGVMPDWNPAEIIGTRPRRSATSLYRSLITDRIWARARAAYGYRDVGNTPVLVDLGGLPYIDVRASAASLIPAALPDVAAGKLADYYVRRLVEAPHLHDKFEFEVVLSAWMPGAEWWVRRYLSGVLNAEECRLFAAALRELTEDMVIGSRPWQHDLDALMRLETGRAAAVNSPQGSTERIARLLESTRLHGTLPFARLARGAFVATHILNRAVAEGAVDRRAGDDFLASASRVTSQLVSDMSALNANDFLDRYGHLRPGTYDLLSPRYDERPDHYLAVAVDTDWSKLETPSGPREPDLSGLDAALRASGLSFGATEFTEFAAQVVRGRELAKLMFTRNLSDAMVEMVRWGAARGLSPDDVSHLTVEAVLADHDDGRLAQLVAEGRAEHAHARCVALPPVLADPATVWSFEMPAAEPNFITSHRVMADVAVVAGGVDPHGRIAFISSADPGYDWIFARGIRGLVTAYGGVNSHMAVRAREFDLPSAIGVGEARFHRWCSAQTVDLDAGGRIVRVVR